MHDELGKLIEEMLGKGIDLPLAARAFERLYIEKALEETKGNRTRAAELLGIHRNTLASKMNGWKPKKRPAPRASRRRAARRKSGRR
jgi:DNA-binding NtrC family response regulator